MAIDGDLATAWTVGEHGDPLGETFRLYFDGEVQQILLVQAARPGARRITQLTIVGRDGSGSITGPTERIELDERSVVAPGQPIAVPPGARSIDLTVEAVAGGVPGTASAVSGVGFAEITSELGHATEIIRPPHDALLATDADTPLALSFSRLRVDPMNRWRDDPEPTLNRRFELPVGRTFDVRTTVRIDARTPDTELAAVLGWPAVASTRLTGSIRHAGVAALDGVADTAWITAFGEAQGATLAIAEITEPITEIAVRQPVGGFSRVTEIALRSGDERRTVELAPDAAGRSLAVVDPPLPAGPLVLELAVVETATTVDRRYGDVIELPAAISEIVIAGAPQPDRLGATTQTFECVTVGLIDETPLTASLVVDERGLLDGGPLPATPCEPSLVLEAGSHLLTPGPDLPITLDGLVLDAGAGAAISRSGPGVIATVVEGGRFERRIRIDGCAAGCWLVFGEGFNPAWSATSDGTSLGEPLLIDGGFNGWWLAAGEDTRDVTVQWTAQRRLTIALITSLLVALLATALMILDRRRAGTVTATVVTEVASPTWSSSPALMSRRRSLVAAALWIVFSAALIGLSWAFWGAVAAVVVLRTRRARLAELTAWACLIVVTGIVLVSEFRNAPFPNGGWPTTFASAHGIGMFAVVAILVAALVADDADYDRAP